ncbi:MAG: hypothetical protein Q4G67_15125, partial [Actinomycetia bacterium]|nr:hypothetical protein [Actinomycetes bacterium]
MKINSVKSYVELVSGLGETSKEMAKEAAADLVALSGIEGKSKRKKAQKKVSKIADDLLEAAESNRKQLVKMVRKEVEEAVAKVETRTAHELAQASATIETLQKQLDELRGLVASGIASAAGKASGAGAGAARAVSDGAAVADESLRLMADAGQERAEAAAASTSDAAP